MLDKSKESSRLCIYSVGGYYHQPPNQPASVFPISRRAVMPNRTSRLLYNRKSIRTFIVISFMCYVMLSLHELTNQRLNVQLVLTPDDKAFLLENEERQAASTHPRNTRAIRDNHHLQAQQHTYSQPEEERKVLDKGINAPTPSLDSVGKFDANNVKGTINEPKSNHLRLDDVHISVKTSKKFHRQRLDVILQTWFTQASQQVAVAHKGEDKKACWKSDKDAFAMQTNSASSQIACKREERANSIWRGRTRVTLQEKTDEDHCFIGQLLQCWLDREKTYFVTDDEDAEYQGKTNGHLIESNCSSSHNRKALCCKMSVELDFFVLMDKKWFCHFDDDNYVNVDSLLDLLGQYDPQQDWYLGKPSIKAPLEIPYLRKQPNKNGKSAFWFATGGAGFCLSRSLVHRMQPLVSNGKFMGLGEKIRLPDDVTIGYVIEYLLGVPLTVVDRLHSHLEPLHTLADDALRKQVSFSYSTYRGNQMNRVTVPGWDTNSDPTRFFSLFCYLSPAHSRNCPPGGISTTV